MATALAEPPVVLGNSTAGASARRRLLPFRPTVSWVSALVTVLIVAIPLFVLLWSSFQVSPLGVPFTPGSVLSLGNYTGVFTDGTLVRPIVNTLFFVVGSLAIGLIISLGLAVVLERTNLPLRGLLFALIIAPVAMPQVVAG